MTDTSPGNIPAPKASAENRDREIATCPIVGIGASAGGLEAFKSLLAHVPEKSGLGYVLIQHLSPDHTSAMAELLGSCTAMPVKQVTEAIAVEPDHVYVIAPNTLLTMREGVLHPATLSEQTNRMPIDHFFRSLAHDQGENAVGVLLSGAGSDGAVGLQAIKRLGGQTIVQAPETCRFDSMPRSALATGVVDHVLPVEEIARKLSEYFVYRRETREEARLSGLDEVSAALPNICSLLSEQLGHDFSRYKQSTLIRRIERRMQMLRLKPAAEYVTLLGKDAKEAEQLFKDLLIGVTEFFRDPETFEVLAKAVIPKLFQQAGPSGTLRIWVSGCASGQEAYSLAILLKEHMNRQGVMHPIQIFATDIDADAVETARQGLYSSDIAEQVSAERLARFFRLTEGGGYQVNKEIREMCIFSVHNLINDPPFSRMDLVVCRNVLIYFDASLQQRVIPLFHYALRGGGYLFLGPAESLGLHADLFRPIEKRMRIFQAKESTAAPAVRLPRPDGGRSNRIVMDTTFKMRLARERDAREVHERALLEWYIPPSVLIDTNGEVLHFVRRTAKFLEPPVGAPSHNIFDMVRDELRAALRAALSEVKRDGVEVTKEHIDIATDKEVQRIALSIRPIRDGEGAPERFLIVFREDGDPRPRESAAPAPVSKSEDVQALQLLEKELRSTKEWLQSTIEELENSNEELKSSNEELISINEEYQSANESLQTSKEELQSLNEELETVNGELSKKLEELDQANADIRNLFASTGIATIFLDREGRIKKFTPAAADLFHLIESDLGRPLLDITARFETDRLWAALQAANKNRGQSAEVEILKREDNSHFIARITPYRTAESRADGVVVNFIDVTRLKEAETALQEAADRKDEFLAMLGHELRNPLAPLKLGLHLLGLSETTPETAADLRDMLGRQVSHLSRIVDELLDVSRISQGKVLLRQEPVDFGSLVQSTISDQQMVFQTSGLELNLHLPGEPLWVEGDPTRICQVISNILHNASKFTDHGGRVNVSLERAGDFAQLTITDTGRGMEPATIQRLFQPFSQAETSIDRGRGGLGLGLALVKGLVELHGGSVEARSEGLGCGSTIVARLPLTETRPESREEVLAREVPSHRIVIIEDNVDAAQALKLLLVACGHEVQTASGGREGIALCREFDADTVICDIGLPGELDGYAVAKTLRRQMPHSPLLLIALTGYGQDQDKQRALDSGFDYHFTKPIGLDQINETLMRFATLKGVAPDR